MGEFIFLPFCFSNIESLAITPEKRDMLGSFLSNIQTKIPQGSSVNLQIDEKDKSFYVELYIKSLQLNFKIECIENNILDVISSLKKLSDIELRNWHQTRIFI